MKSASNERTRRRH